MPTTTYEDFVASIDTVAARTDNSGSPVSPDWRAEERRMILKSFTQGVLSPAAGWQVVQGGGATMNVIVGSGSAEVDLAIIEGLVAGQGNYVARLDEATKTIGLNAADPSNPRIDAIYLVVLDNAYDASGLALPRLALRTGDAASSPTAPGADSSWEAYLLLATIDVPANAADITECTVTDQRVFSTLSFANGGSVPVGTVLSFAGSMAPLGFLLCQGQAISRTTFSRLFAVIGTTYGAGDGSTTFNLPDLRQRFILGKAASGTGSVLGQTGGAIDHTHSGPSHTHSNPSTNSAGSHSHSVGNTGSAGNHFHSLDTTSAPPNDLVEITAGQHTITTTNGSHSHTNPNTGSGGAHTHTQGNTGAAGTGQTGSNNPPYIVLNHVIKV